MPQEHAPTLTHVPTFRCGCQTAGPRKDESGSEEGAAPTGEWTEARQRQGREDRLWADWCRTRGWSGWGGERREGQGVG